MCTVMHGFRHAVTHLQSLDLSVFLSQAGLAALPPHTSSL